MLCRCPRGDSPHSLRGKHISRECPDLAKSGPGSLLLAADGLSTCTNKPYSRMEQQGLAILGPVSPCSGKSAKITGYGVQV